VSDQLTAEPTEFWVDSGGVRIHGYDWGGARDGAPVIMLHGAGGTGLSWNMLGPRLVAALGQSYRFVSIDQRGGGLSDKPEREYEAEYFGRDVLAVQHALGGAPATLIGHSRGGWQSAFTAAAWPTEVERLVLVDPARISFASVADADEFYGKVRTYQGPFASADAAIEHAQRVQPDAYWGPERQAAVLNGLLEGPDGTLFGKMPHRVIDQLQRVRLDADIVRPMMANISVPTLLFVSSRSNQARQNQKLEYAQLITGTEVIMLDGTHNLAHDCVEEMATAIVKLFADG
jgi:pimeloyl-ACP methyl ester carboxylesterase